MWVSANTNLTVASMRVSMRVNTNQPIDTSLWQSPCEQNVHVVFKGLIRYIARGHSSERLPLFCSTVRQVTQESGWLEEQYAGFGPGELVSTVLLYRCTELLCSIHRFGTTTRVWRARFWGSSGWRWRSTGEDCVFGLRFCIANG
eukprot:728761-Pyramimonas_sp.AAC.1